MAEEKPSRRIRIEEWLEASTCKKRYGRAVLTIRRWTTLGAVEELHGVLDAYRDGESDAEAVCWVFVKTRVVKHSPSFSWDSADLHRLLELVVECSESPHFNSTDPARLTEDLLKEQERERERRKKTAEALASSLDRVMPSFQKIAPQLAASALGPNFASKFADLQKSIQLSSGFAERTRLAGISGPGMNELMSAVKTGIAKQYLPPNMPSLGGQVKFVDMARLADQSAAAASAAEQDDAAHALGAAAEAFEKSENESEIEALEHWGTRLVEELKAVIASARPDDPANPYFVALVSAVISTALLILATRAGLIE